MVNWSSIGHIRQLSRSNRDMFIPVTVVVNGEVAKVSYCYYSGDSREIFYVQQFRCMEVAKNTDCDWTFWDILPVAPHGHFRMLHPAKG